MQGIRIAALSIMLVQLCVCMDVYRDLIAARNTCRKSLEIINEQITYDEEVKRVKEIKNDFKEMIENASLGIGA